MESRQKEDKSESVDMSSVESGLLLPKTPDLSLKKIDRTVSFRLPKPRRRDPEADNLPDITPELLIKLNSLWNLEDIAEDRPVSVLIRAVREHLDAINPYIEMLKDDQRSWFECWGFLYKIAQNLDQAAEDRANMRFYSVPEDLRMKELRSRMNLGKADTEWEAAKAEYTNEFDKRLKVITALEADVKAISEAKNISDLQKYNVSLIARRQVEENGGHEVPKRTFCACIYSLFFRKPSSSAINQVEAVQNQNQDFQDLRAKLITQYNDEIKFKTDLLNIFGETAPKKSDNYRREWNEIKGKIMHDQIDFYRCQSKEVMLHCIRLYSLAFRTYYLIYGENPVADTSKTFDTDSKKVEKIYDEQDKLVFKAKDCFKQLVRGMKNNMSMFYCLQPDRCEFNKYLDNYVNIRSAEERDAILAGNATKGMLEKVFPDFESPEEAFKISII